MAIKSRRMRWAGHVAGMEEGRGVHSVLVGRTEGKSPLGRRRNRWEDNIKLDLRELRIDGVNWIQLAQDRDQWRAFVSFGFHKESRLLSDELSDYQLLKEYPAPWSK
jgi:hypothetical protein